MRKLHYHIPCTQWDKFRLNRVNHLLRVTRPVLESLVPLGFRYPPFPPCPLYLLYPRDDQDPLYLHFVPCFRDPLSLPYFRIVREIRDLLSGLVVQVAPGHLRLPSPRVLLYPPVSPGNRGSPQLLVAQLAHPLLFLRVHLCILIIIK